MLRVFCPKMPEFYTIIARKIFFRILVGGGGHVPPAPPVSYAYTHFTLVEMFRNFIMDTELYGTLRILRFVGYADDSVRWTTDTAEAEETDLQSDFGTCNGDRML